MDRLPRSRGARLRLRDHGVRCQAHLAEKRQEALPVAGPHDGIVAEETEKSPGAVLAGVDLRVFQALHPERTASETEAGAARPDRRRRRRGELGPHRPGRVARLFPTHIDPPRPGEAAALGLKSSRSGRRASESSVLDCRCPTLAFMTDASGVESPVKWPSRMTVTGDFS